MAIGTRGAGAWAALARMARRISSVLDRSADGPQQRRGADRLALGLPLPDRLDGIGNLAVHIIHGFDGALEGPAIAFVLGTFLGVVHLIEHQQARAEFLEHHGLEHRMCKVVGEGAAMIRIGIIGDRNEAILAHRAIDASLPLVAKDLQMKLEWDWLHTAALAAGGEARLEKYDGLWCTPGSPYADTRAALHAIEFVRESRRPYLGTCGGFQHALMEYAESIWKLPLAAHAEESPEAVDPVISRLECSLVEVSETLQLVAGSRLAAIYGSKHIEESYHCNYGLNPVYASRLASGDLSVSARDHTGQVRAVELHSHPFFVATLFQPERAALAQRTPPLVKAFVVACLST